MREACDVQKEALKFLFQQQVADFSSTDAAFLEDGKFSSEVSFFLLIYKLKLQFFSPKVSSIPSRLRIGRL